MVNFLVQKSIAGYGVTSVLLRGPECLPLCQPLRACHAIEKSFKYLSLLRDGSFIHKLKKVQKHLELPKDYLDMKL